MPESVWSVARPISKLLSSMLPAKRCGMRSDVTALIYALSILASSCATHSMSRAEKRANENEARAAALHWLQLLDTGDYEEAFEFEAQDFRMSRTQSQFVRLMKARRAPFGKSLVRKFFGAARVRKMVGAPEGKY